MADLEDVFNYGYNHVWADSDFLGQRITLLRFKIFIKYTMFKTTYGTDWIYVLGT